MIRLTVPIHFHLEALAKATGLALIPPVEVHGARARFLAHVVQVPADAALEKAATPVAAGHTVMLAGRLVATHPAQLLLRRLLGLGSRRRRRRVLITPTVVTVGSSGGVGVGVGVGVDVTNDTMDAMIRRRRFLSSSRFYHYFIVFLVFSFPIGVSGTLLQLVVVALPSRLIRSLNG